jgi:hypothetical protein
VHNSRSSKDFADVHGLVIHAYNPPNAESFVDHLGLHKALCVLMGWDYTKVPENSKAYQSLPADLVRASREDLIVWPPIVIIQNTATGRKKDGRCEGIGNKDMDKKMTGIYIAALTPYENSIVCMQAPAAYVIICDFYSYCITHLQKNPWGIGIIIFCTDVFKTTSVNFHVPIE